MLTRHARLLFLLLLAAGVVQRVVRLALNFPIWGDEAFVCLNLLDRSPAELVGPLRFDQVAPALFLWIEWAALHLLGPSEASLRLPSLLAGVAALVLFVRLARLTLPRGSALLAAGILAVAYYPVRHACEVKPYAFDLLAALLLLTPAAAWLRRPGRMRPLVVLVVVVPFALAVSYPAALVGGGVSLALLPVVLQHGRRGAWLLYLGYNALLVGVFMLIFLAVGRQQHASMMASAPGYWDASFPPAEPGALAQWLADVHTGYMLAYPVGGRNGGSILTLIACLAGLAALASRSRRPLLILLLAPFLLTFIAAALHRYPYGGSARVAQHLAPAICLLAGRGLAALCRRRLALAVPLAALALVAVIGIVRDVRKPWKTPGDEQARQAVHTIEQRADGAERICCVAPPRIYPSLEWYLRLLGERVEWVEELPEDTGGVCCVRFLTNADPGPCEGREWIALDLGDEEDATRGCEVWTSRLRLGDSAKPQAVSEVSSVRRPCSERTTPVSDQPTAEARRPSSTRP